MKRTVLVLSVSAMLLGCKSQGGRVGVPEPATVLRMLHGDDQGLAAPVVLLINSAEDLAATGSQRLSELNADFTRESIVLVALGQRPTTGYWAHIDAIQTDAKAVYVQATANRPGASAVTAPTLTHPFCAAVIAKTGGALRSEISSVEDQTPPWETEGSAAAQPSE